MVDLSNIQGKKLFAANAGKSKTSQLTTESESPGGPAAGASADSGYKKFSLTNVRGETHSLVIREDGVVYDYNETTDEWATRDNQGIWVFHEKGDADFTGNTIDFDNIDIDSLTFISGSTSTSQALNGEHLSDYDIGTKDSATIPVIERNDQYVVAVIDNFDTPLDAYDMTNDNFVDMGFAHGDLVEAVLTSGNDDDADSSNDLKTTEYNVFDGNEISYSAILEALEDIETKNSDSNSSNDIDAINLSLGVATTLSQVGLDSLDGLSEDERKAALSQLDGDLVKVINKISDLAADGVQVYISSGNEANDTYYDQTLTDSENIFLNAGDSEVWFTDGDGSYEAYEDYDTNDDGNITADELYQGFKDLDTDDDNKISNYELYADYDTDGDGTITGRELGVFNALTLATGNNVHVIGASDSLSDDEETSSDGVADYSNDNILVDEKVDGDVFIDYLGYNSITGNYEYDTDGDGKVDLVSKVKRDGEDGYFSTGTSFASPLAAREDGETKTA